MKICEVEICDREARSHGLCLGHYERMLKGQPLNSTIKTHFATHVGCSEKDCTREHYAKGLCRHHYATVLRISKIDPENSIKFGKQCLIDGCNTMIKKSSHIDYCSNHERIKNKHLIGKEIKGENHWSWRGGVADYENHTEMKRSRILKFKQTNGRCEDCNKEAKVIHHLDKSKNNHALDNLKALCNKCHGKYHKGDRGRKPKYGNFTLKQASLEIGCSVNTLRNYLKDGKESIDYQEKINKFLDSSLQRGK